MEKQSQAAATEPTRRSTRARATRGIFSPELAPQAARPKQQRVQQPLRPRQQPAQSGGKGRQRTPTPEQESDVRLGAEHQAVLPAVRPRPAAPSAQETRWLAGEVGLPAAPAAAANTWQAAVVLRPSADERCARGGKGPFAEPVLWHCGASAIPRTCWHLQASTGLCLCPHRWRPATTLPLHPSLSTLPCFPQCSAAQAANAHAVLRAVLGDERAAAVGLLSMGSTAYSLTAEEEAALEAGMREFGRDFRTIRLEHVPTRSVHDLQVEAAPAGRVAGRR